MNLLKSKYWNFARRKAECPIMNCHTKTKTENDLKIHLIQDHSQNQLISCIMKGIIKE